MTTRERLQALHAEATRNHVRFEKLWKRRAALSKGITATMATTALGTGISSATEASTTLTVTLATLLLATTAAKLLVDGTEHDRDLQRTSEAWRRHRIEASRLLAREAAQKPGDTPGKIECDTIDLEQQATETRGDSLLIDPFPKPEPVTPPPTGN